jgi:hypothetical protein
MPFDPAVSGYEGDVVEVDDLRLSVHIALLGDGTSIPVMRGQTLAARIEISNSPVA